MLYIVAFLCFVGIASCVKSGFDFLLNLRMIKANKRKTAEELKWERIFRDVYSA